MNNRGATNLFWLAGLGLGLDWTGLGLLDLRWLVVGAVTANYLFISPR